MELEDSLKEISKSVFKQTNKTTPEHSSNLDSLILKAHKCNKLFTFVNSHPNIWGRYI